MMSFDSFLIFYGLLSLVSLGFSLRLLELRVPSLVDVRDKAVLVCLFDLEGDKFLSLKWYKEELEFFRYMPDFVPRIQTFKVDGINLVETLEISYYYLLKDHLSSDSIKLAAIDAVETYRIEPEHQSNISTIVLSPLEYKSSGLYRCEVSAEAPHFKVVYQHANMSVLGLPKEDPKIEGVQASYSVGGYVTANCTSSPSYPPAKMDWFINGMKAQQWFLDYYYVDRPESELQLESRTIGLKFQADSSHFHQNDGYLSLVCLATVSDVTRTSETKAYLTKLTKEKFAQQFTNYYGRNKAEFLLLVVLVIVIHL